MTQQESDGHPPGHPRHRFLSVFQLVMINLIAIDSLRSLPMNARYGWAIITFYVLGCVFFFVPCLLVTAQFATHYPHTGGAYVWVKKAMGTRFAFMNVWLEWIYNIVWYPAILSFIAASVAYLLHPGWIDNKIYMMIMVIVTFILATLLNLYGMKLSSWVSTVGSLLGTLVPMIFIIGFGATWLLSGHHSAMPFSFSALIPHESHFANASFFLVVLFSLMGIEMSAVHAEEVKNPEHDFPKALAFSGGLIVLILTLASLAIAFIVPHQQLNILNGINQALAICIATFYLPTWLLPLLVFLMILGGLGGLATWVIGTTKGLVVAAQDGCTPKWLSHFNRFGSPHRVLQLQALVVLSLAGTFLLFPTVADAYWALSNLTAQLALTYYILIFLAAILLRNKLPATTHGFRIWGGSRGTCIVAMMGLVTCIFAFCLGFIPPQEVPIQPVLLYELLLLGGIAFFCLLPWLIYRWNIK